MSRDKNYQRLLNSKRWKELRQWKLQENPLCEVCQEHGIISAAVDIHHKRPVETAETLDEMESICFNPANLQSVCISCHAKIHKQMKSHSKSAHQQRARERLERWLSKHKRNGLSDTTGTADVDSATKD